jgi:hypothetical protein
MLLNRKTPNSATSNICRSKVRQSTRLLGRFLLCDAMAVKAQSFFVVKNSSDCWPSISNALIMFFFESSFALGALMARNSCKTCPMAAEHFCPFNKSADLPPSFNLLAVDFKYRATLALGALPPASCLARLSLDWRCVGAMVMITSSSLQKWTDRLLFFCGGVSRFRKVGWLP